VSRLVELVAACKRSGDLGPLVDAIPYAAFMGMSVRVEGGDLVGVMRYSDHLIGNPALPALHGGTLGALLESTAIFQLLWEADTVVLPKTINVTVDYLRSGQPLDTYARGVITRHGRRVVNVQASAWQEDPGRPIALASCHFLIEPDDATSGS
jgi:acyl-coenzyme A thioesterase PaaI-like protein